jgi:hypothetical protein
MHCSCTQQHDAANNNVNNYTASNALLKLQLAAVHILQTRGNTALLCALWQHTATPPACNSPHLLLLVRTRSFKLLEAMQ